MSQIEDEILMNNPGEISEEEKILELKLKFNLELYEQKVISYEVFKLFRQKIMRQINKL